ncbi:MAG: HD domain-containing phosphohydrolase [Vulcanimicrobiota bacterium]
MYTKHFSLHISEIIEFTALKELIETFCDTAGVQISIIDEAGNSVYMRHCDKDSLYDQCVRDLSYNSRIPRLMISSDEDSSEFSHEIHYKNSILLAEKIMVDRKPIAYILAGPFPEMKAMSESDCRDGGAPKKDCSRTCEEMKEKSSRIIKTCAHVIAEFFIECYQSSQYVARMSTLYEIGNTINSTLKMEKVSQIVLDSSIEMLNAQAGSIMIIDEDKQDMKVLVEYGLNEVMLRNKRINRDEGISGEVAASGKPVILLKSIADSSSEPDNSRKETESAICVPLKTKGRVIGVLNIIGKNDGDDFSQEDLEMLEILASKAAGGIHNANLFLSLQQKARELEALYKIGTTITSSTEKKRVLTEVLKSARKLLKAKKGSLMLLNKEKGELSIEVAYGLPKKIVKIARPKLGEGIAGKVALEGKPRLMLKGIRESESKKSENETHEIPSAISVPIRIKDNLIGVLNVSDREDEDNFSSESVDLLMMLANQAAVALENSRLLQELHELFVESITALANAIDARDPYTRGHSQRVTEYSLRICKHLPLSQEEIDYIQYAALLHDIGKIHIRDDILHKPGKLSESEFEEMQKHPAYGAKIMEPVKRFRTILPYMFHHHEKFTGKGYPYHLKGEEIPLAARIIAVADAFDAMTSDRPYRKGFSTEEAIKELERNAGTQFDPMIVEIFIKIIKED